jgi:hypothetical protein
MVRTREGRMVARIKGWYREQALLPRVVIGTVAVLAVILALYGLWSLSLAFVKPHSVKERISFVQMVVGIIGGLTLIGGLLVNFWGQWKNQKATLEQLDLTRKAQDENQKATLKQLDLTRQGQITDRFTQAIDQLGKTDDEKDKIEEVRLGGIYALAQLAVEEADRYHWPIMQVFAAYLRRYASWQGDPSKQIIPAADVETVLSIIGRRSRYYEAGENEPLDLSRTDFSNYRFPVGAHLEGASLIEAHFENAALDGAQLQTADLRAAHLEGAYLNEANLRGADLRGAHLEGAYLWKADLRDANIGNTYLTMTYLPGAKLQGAKNLDPKSLEDANGTFGAEYVETEVGEIPRPKWWNGLPGNGTRLYPGDYSIKVWKTLLSFSNLGEFWRPDTYWHSDLFCPYAFSLTPAGVYFGGSSVFFCSGPWVCDPQRPKEYLALEPAPKDIVAWFEKHPYLRLTEAPNDWENSSSSMSGEQFDVEVDPDTPDNEISMGSGGPWVPIFPTFPRFGSLGPTKGKRLRVIVLEHKDERIFILTFSPAKEFAQFKERVDKEVLASLYWSKNPDEQSQGG